MSAEKPNSPAALAAKAQRRRRIIDSWPLLVWIGVAVLAFFAYREGASLHRMNGTVADDTRKIASTERGKIKEILVDFGDVVKEGQVVCRLYTDKLDREIELVAQETRMNNLQARRRSQNDFTALDLEIKETLALKNRSEADLKELQEELERVKRRFQVRKATSDDVAEAQGKVDKEAANVQTYIELIRVKEIAKTDLQERLQNLDVLLGTGEEAEPVDPPEVRLLKTRRDAMTLTSPTNGTVTMRHAEPGDIVDPGDKILEISSSGGPVRVAALIPAEHIAELKNGDTLWVTTPSKRAEFIEAKLVTVGQKLISVRDGGSVVDRNTSGRPVLLELAGDHEIVPGSPVFVHIKKPSLFKFLYWLR